VTEKGRSPWSPVRLHETRDLPLDDLSECRGIPVTSVARTFVDLAAVVDERALRRAWHEAEVLRLLDVRAVEAVLDRSNGRRGTGRLRRLLPVSAAPTRTELEARFLDLIRAHGLPMPAVNTFVHEYEVDFYWAAERLAVETDGAHVHDTRRRFEDDRRRDVELAKRGIHVARFTWRRVVDEPAAVAADVIELLNMRAELLGVAVPSRQAG
jgi:very-short-patch-repair endonuclease